MSKFEERNKKDRLNAHKSHVN